MKIKTLGSISLLLFLYGLFAVSNIFAATLIVTKTEDTADGTCDADCSLREAVAAANSDDVIVFSPLFSVMQTITLTGGQITLNKNITIFGTGPQILSVSGNSASRIFYISGEAIVTLNGMKLKNGLANTESNPNGGAIYLTDSMLSLTNMELSDNVALFTPPPPSPTTRGQGGGLYSENSAVWARNCVVTDNLSGSGIYSTLSSINLLNSTVKNHTVDGIQSRLSTINVADSLITNNLRGIVGFEEDNISVSNTTLSGNRQTALFAPTLSVVKSTITGNGGAIGATVTLTIDRSIIVNTLGGDPAGGIYNSGLASITNSVINNNRTSGAGGGIFNSGTAYISGSAITGNSAQGAGGGIHNAGQAFLTNSTVSGNIAGSSGASNIPGGGISNYSRASLLLTNSTIANNRSTGVGGGLLNDATSTATTRNTIIASNLSAVSGNDVSGAVVSQGFNLIGSTTGSLGWIVSDLVNRNPLLAPLGNNGGNTLTQALMPTSPAINAGNNSLASEPVNNHGISYDQRGFVRFVGGANFTIDIGAYEANYASTSVTLSGRVLSASGSGINSVRISLTDANGTSLSTLSNSLGYYSFANLPPGTTYSIVVFHKLYQFNSPQSVTVDNNRNDLNFVSLQ